MISVTRSHPGASTAIVAVTVACVNDAPVADSGAATIDEDVAVTMNMTGSDIDGDALIFAGPAYGYGGSIDDAYVVTYTPAAAQRRDGFTRDGMADRMRGSKSIRSTIRPQLTMARRPPAKMPRYHVGRRYRGRC